MPTSCTIRVTCRRWSRGLSEPRVDMVSEMVRLNCTSLAERALVPAFVYFFQMLYPFARVNDPRSPVAAAAGGTILIRREALERIGGIAVDQEHAHRRCCSGEGGQSGRAHLPRPFRARHTPSVPIRGSRISGA